MQIAPLLLDISDSELDYLYEYAQVLLGGIQVDVDIEKDELKVLLRKSLRNYLYELNTYQLRNTFDDVKGMDVNTNFTLKYVYDNMMMSKRVSDWFASMARVGGMVSWKKDYFELQEGKQIYNLATDSSNQYKPDTRVYHKVLWYGRPEIKPNSSDNLFNNNLFSFGQAGLNNPGYTLGFLGNIYDTILIAQSLEERTKVLRSEFFYSISGDIIELTPLAEKSGVFKPGDKVFYYYFDKSDMYKLSPDDQQLIINPYQVKIDEIKWSELNSMARNWIEEYAIALAKYLQGSKWRRIRTIASPNSDYQVELDYQSLIDESKAEIENLKEDLRNELTKIDKKQMMLDKAEMVDAASKINQKSPRRITWG